MMRHFPNCFMQAILSRWNVVKGIIDIIQISVRILDTIHCKCAIFYDSGVLSRSNLIAYMCNISFVDRYGLSFLRVHLRIQRIPQ